MKENTTLWLYDALKLYADDNWVDGNQKLICRYIYSKLKETDHVLSWGCLGSESNNIYGWRIGKQ